MPYSVFRNTGKCLSHTHKGPLRPLCVWLNNWLQICRCCNVSIYKIKRQHQVSLVVEDEWHKLNGCLSCCCCCCCRPHSTNVLPAESSTRNRVAASSLSPQVARKGSTLSGFVQRSRLEREVGRDLHSNKWEEV